MELQKVNQLQCRVLFCLAEARYGPRAAFLTHYFQVDEGVAFEGCYVRGGEADQAGAVVVADRDQGGCVVAWDAGTGGRAEDQSEVQLGVVDFFLFDDLDLDSLVSVLHLDDLLKMGVLSWGPRRPINRLH